MSHWIARTANSLAPGRRTSRLSAVVAGVVVLILSGCRGDAQIAIDLNAAGEGYVEAVVELDSQAVAQVGDPTKLLKVADLRGDGWAIRNPESRAAGGIVVRARKNVRGLRQAEAALHELTSKGVLDGVQIRQVGRVITRGLQVRGVVDLTKGIDSFGDERVREVLGSASAIGVDEADLVRLLGAPAPEAIHLELVTTLDGRSSRLALPLGLRTSIALGTAHWYADVIIPVVLCLFSLGGLATLWFIDRRAARVGSHDDTTDSPSAGFVGA